MQPGFNCFGIKQLYEWRLRQRSRRTIIEERIVMVAGRSFDSACRKVHAEARRYCQDDPQENFRIIPLSTVLSGYLMGPIQLDRAAVVEVFSMLHRDVLRSKRRQFVKTHLLT
jgi:hypothetical protein